LPLEVEERVKMKAAVRWLLCIVILLAGGIVFYWTYWRPRIAPNFPLGTWTPRIKWKQTLPDMVTSSPVIGNDGSIYTTTYSGKIYAFDRSGKVRWTYHTDLNDIPSALMRDAEGNLYLPTTRKVFSLNASGQKRWETVCAPQNAILRLPEEAALTRDLVLTTCGQNFVALATTDGRQLWNLPGAASPVVLGGGSIVLTHGASVIAVDRNGNSLWKFPPPGYIPPKPRPGLIIDRLGFSSPIAVGSDDTLYGGSGDGEFSSFGPDGVLRWTYNFGPLRGIQFFTSPVITSGGTVIAVSSEASVYAFTGTGDLRWSVHVGAPVKNFIQPAPVLGSDGTIYVLVSGKLVALSDVGTKLWELPLPSDAVTSPTLALDGTLYIATTDSTLYAVQTASKGLMSSGWPKFQRDLGNSGSNL
jgi:outer membrane protein assembly factor BamB